MKTLSKFFAIVTVVAAFAACEDVPMPYEINEPAGGGKTLPYSTVAPKAGWTMLGIDNLSNPWSAGSDYTQATGYQKWDGASAKTNREVSGVLVSPAFNTAAKSGKIKISIDYCIAYAKNDASYKDHVIVYVAKGADVKKFDKAEWTALSWKPTFESSDWTLKTEEIQVPDSFANQKDVRIAFWFYAPESGSTTFEIKNFIFEEGVAGDNPDDPVGEKSTKEKPYSVAQAQTGVGSQYVKGYIVGYVDGQNYKDSCVFAVPSAAQTEILLADSPDETSCDKCIPVQLPAGAIRTALELKANSGLYKKEVEVYGSLEKYFGVPGIKSTSWALVNGKAVGTDPDAPKPVVDDSTKEDPLTVAKAQIGTGNQYVKGYIVGYVEGQVYDSGAKFGVAASVETNLLLADNAGETDLTKCMPVQLPTGAIRDALKPTIASNIGKQVELYGSLEKYFGTAGIKSVTWALLDNKSIGKDPTKEDVIAGEPKGTGTQTDPYNIAGVLKFIATLGADKNSSSEVYVSGTVTAVKEIDTGQYGNATFTLSDDAAGSNVFTVYRCYSFGNQHFTDSKAVKVGDKVVVKGLVVNYKGNTPETVQNKACLYSVNGATN